MPSFASDSRTGRAGELWPVVLLLVVVAVPTIGVLWFVGVAMENQRLATEQQLTEAYRLHLDNVQKQLDRDWRDSMERAETLLNAEPERPAEIFAAGVTGGLADSVVLYGEDGGIQYPAALSEPPDQEFGPDWKEARRLENQLSDPRGAQEIYARLSREAETPEQRIAAAQAQLRCLFKAGETASATRLVNRLCEQDVFASLADSRSRSIAANIQLMAIERLGATSDIEPVLNLLLQWVNDYSQPPLSSPQRLFLMKRLASIAPDRVDQRLLRAEELAGRYAATDANAPGDPTLRESPLPGVWQAGTPSGRMVILLQEETVRDKSVRSAIGATLPSEAKVLVHPPGEDPQPPPFLSVAAGPHLPGWNLSLSLLDSQEIDTTATQRNRLYLWTGALVVLFTSVLAVFIARAFRRQLRLANLKNDLVGTVSHELKTPLSSMRLLVDTLLEEDRLDEGTTREYLQLIAKENRRLSRLIENFLTFTRMEQDRRSLDLQPLEPRDIVTSAIESAGERFQSEDCSLSVNVDEDLPFVDGDKDALVTVLLNLLDNAYKYSDDPREISLHAGATSSGIEFAVADNGIGFSRTASRRIFQRFFQLDSSLARDRGGCGLGLSIVDSIVKAHRGDVTVTSTQGKGSTFTVTLPTRSQKSSHPPELVS